MRLVYRVLTHCHGVVLRAGFEIGGLILLMQAGLLPATELPEAAGVIDVTRPPYNADNTGRRDATAALLQAMHEAGRRTPGIFTTTDRAVQIVYLPKGIYRISDTLCFENAEIRAARPTKEAGRRRYIEGHMMLVGENRDATIIRLEDRCPKFQAGPKPMLRMTLKDASNQSVLQLRAGSNARCRPWQPRRCRVALCLQQPRRGPQHAHSLPRSGEACLRRA